MRINALGVAFASALLLAILTSPAAAEATQPHRTTHSTMTVRQEFSALGTTGLADLSCTPKVGCVALGLSWPSDVLYRSNPGATKWTAMAGPSSRPVGLQNGTQQHVAASCASPSFCMVELSGEGGGFVATGNGGKTWKSANGFAKGNLIDVSHLSCPRVGVCVGDDHGELISTNDAGVHWRLHPAGAGTVIGLSCPGTTTCFVLQRALTLGGPEVLVSRTSNLGATMKQLARFSDGTIPAASAANIYCASAMSCGVYVAAALGGVRELHTTSNGGTSWKTRALPRSGPVVSIACGGAGSCTLLALTTDRVDLDSLTTSDGGTTWSTAVMAPYTGPDSFEGLNEMLACTSASRCLGIDPLDAGGQDLLYRLDTTHSTWTNTHLAEGAATQVAVACAPSGPCIAKLAGRQATSTNGGKTWTYRLEPALDGVEGLSCPFGSTCFASGSTPGASPPAAMLDESSDAGSTWTPVTLPAGLSAVGKVACATSTTCMTIATGYLGQGAQVLRTTDGGVTWTLVTVTAQGTSDALSALACPSATQCLAVGSVPEQCVQRCYHGPFAARSTDAGATWQIVTPNEAGYAEAGLSGLACLPSLACVTSGELFTDFGDTNYAYVTSDGGETWSKGFSMPGSWGAVVSACASSVCWGIGSDFEGGFGWPAPRPPYALLERGTEGGTNWAVAANAPGNVLSIRDLAVSQSGTIILVGTNIDHGPVLCVAAN